MSDIALTHQKQLQGVNSLPGNLDDNDINPNAIPIDTLQGGELMPLDIQAKEVDNANATPLQQGGKTDAPHIQDGLGGSHVSTGGVAIGVPNDTSLLTIKGKANSLPLAARDAGRDEQATPEAKDLLQVGRVSLDAQALPAHTGIEEEGVGHGHGVVGGDVEIHASAVEMAEMTGPYVEILSVAAEKGRGARVKP